MHLDEDDLHTFAQLHWKLLFFVKQEADLFDEQEFDDVGELLYFLDDSVEGKLELFNAFYEKPTVYIDAYLAKNPDRLSAKESTIVESWKALRVGEFVAFRQLQRHAVFLGTGDDDQAYGVFGLSEAVDSAVGGTLPVQVHTALFPFNGVIVCDGLMSRFPFGFTTRGEKLLNEQYKAAKSGPGVVVQLSPLGAPKRQPNTAERVARLTEKLRVSLATIRERRRGLHEFQNEVEPPFRQWLGKTHGDLQKRLESLNNETDRLAELLQLAEVSWHFREHRTKAKTLDAVEQQLRDDEVAQREMARGEGEHSDSDSDSDCGGDRDVGGSGGGSGERLSDRGPTAGQGAAPFLDEIPDFLIDSLLGDFLHDVRGIDIARLSAKEIEKARREFLGSFDHVANGDHDAFERSILRIGADDSEKNRSAVKKAFRRLARQVHPDHNPDFGDEAKAIWEELQLRRDALDLDALEMLEMKWRLIRGDAFSGRDEKLLKILRERLSDEELDLDAELDQCSEHPMWGEKPTHTPPAAVRKRVRRDLKSSIATLQEEKARLERDIAIFRGGRAAKKKPSAATTVSTKKSAARKAQAARKQAKKKTQLRRKKDKATPEPLDDLQSDFDFG